MLLDAKMIYKDKTGFQVEFEGDVPDDEKKFYLRVYPIVNMVSDRKVHCTVCNQHIGTAPCQENIIRMHPVLKVTHCKTCHEFYNSGEFSKGEDGSELYCRWCGQGGEVYCCSKCPYVFCKSCILLNLSQNVVTDIEDNENWNCFSCAPKIMWHLRAQHWALTNFIKKQKEQIQSKNLSDAEMKKLMSSDSSVCCESKNSQRRQKPVGNLLDSSNSNDHGSVKKRKSDKSYSKISQASESDSSDEKSEPKKQKTNNEVVCTPDVLSMLQTNVSPVQKKVIVKEKPVQNQKKLLTIQQKPKVVQTIQGTPQQQSPGRFQLQIVPKSAPQFVVSNQQYKQSSAIQTQTHQNPPPLIIRNFGTSLRPVVPTVVQRKTVASARPPPSVSNRSPVYHTINGFRIDLNSAAQQETFRLPNGKLIQVKRQGTPQNAINMPSINTVNQQNIVAGTNPGVHSGPINQVIRAQIHPRSILPSQNVLGQQSNSASGVQQVTIQQPHLATIRYSTAQSQAVAGTLTARTPSGTVLLNGSQSAGQQITRTSQVVTQQLVRHVFSSGPVGQARAQLQNQVFTAMEICQYLTGKVLSLTNSNAYKSVKSCTDVKELYIHLSYLFTYAIGRFKGLQDKCLDDMKNLGFSGDAANLKNGQFVSDKQNNEGDDDDIEIVEPNTTCIDLDSDDESQASESKKNDKSKQSNEPQLPVPSTTLSTTFESEAATSNSSLTHLPTYDESSDNKTEDDIGTTANILAEILGVELYDDDSPSTSNSSTGNNKNIEPKKPRKKTTNKPNPHLLKQMEKKKREEIKEMMQNDTKLKLLCSVVLERLDEQNFNSLNKSSEVEKDMNDTTVDEENQKSNKIFEQDSEKLFDDNKKVDNEAEIDDQTNKISSEILEERDIDESSKDIKESNEVKNNTSDVNNSDVSAKEIEIPENEMQASTEKRENNDISPLNLLEISISESAFLDSNNLEKEAMEIVKNFTAEDEKSESKKEEKYGENEKSTEKQENYETEKQIQEQENDVNEKSTKEQKREQENDENEKSNEKEIQEQENDENEKSTEEQKQEQENDENEKSTEEQIQEQGNDKIEKSTGDRIGEVEENENQKDPTNEEKMEVEENEDVFADFADCSNSELLKINEIDFNMGNLIENEKEVENDENNENDKGKNEKEKEYTEHNEMETTEQGEMETPEQEEMEITEKEEMEITDQEENNDHIVELNNIMKSGEVIDESSKTQDSLLDSISDVTLADYINKDEDVLDAFTSVTSSHLGEFESSSNALENNFLDDFSPDTILAANKTESNFQTETNIECVNGLIDETDMNALKDTLFECLPND